MQGKSSPTHGKNPLMIVIRTHPRAADEGQKLVDMRFKNSALLLCARDGPAGRSDASLPVIRHFAKV